jgi:hypothetical protein
MTPEGSLVYDRVVADAGDALATALDRSLTGYAVLEPQDTLLLDERGRGVLGLRDGVPVTAFHSATGREGADAVADLAVSGPFRAVLRDHPPGPTGGAPIEPGVPADLLAADADLAARTREAAPADTPTDAGDSPDAVDAFLANEEQITAIRERAREEAERRAEEWGFADAT